MRIVFALTLLVGICLPIFARPSWVDDDIRFGIGNADYAEDDSLEQWWDSLLDKELTSEEETPKGKVEFEMDWEKELRELLSALDDVAELGEEVSEKEEAEKSDEENHINFVSLNSEENEKEVDLQKTHFYKVNDADKNEVETEDHSPELEKETESDEEFFQQSHTTEGPLDALIKLVTITHNSNTEEDLPKRKISEVDSMAIADHGAEESSEIEKSDSKFLVSPDQQKADLLKHVSVTSPHSELLTNEYFDNLLDLVYAQSHIYEALDFMQKKNLQLYEQIFAANGNPTVEYNGQEHRQIETEIATMLSTLDKVREKVLEVKSLEEKRNYHLLLNSVVKEIYGDK